MPTYTLGAARISHQYPYMAWRIDEQVTHGEIDNRQRDRLTGRIWFVGRDEPIELDLTGNPWADLAGHILRFRNPDPKPGSTDGFNSHQVGMVGDITASRKVRIPDCSEEELIKCYEQRRPFPWHWANSLYLEWFSLTNGRVVIESGTYEMEIDPEPSWKMNAGEEEAQRIRNAEALTDFMDRLGAALAAADEDFDDDAPQSDAEAKAEAETEWMNRLLDRVSARIEREGADEFDFDVIYKEERERLRRECGIPPDPEPTPEQLAERQEWINEMNAVAAESLQELESEAWNEKPEPKRPALLDRAMELSIQIRGDIEEWVPEAALEEFPLYEIAKGVQLAAVKIGGALGHDDDEPWPPDALFAADTLVRLKKSRDSLRDALLAMDCADEENLAPAAWRITTRREIAEILGEVQTHIQELRDVLKEGGDDK